MEGFRIELHRKIVSDWYDGIHDARFPGGEDYHELWERMRMGYKKVLSNKECQNVIIVGHGGGFKYTLKSFCRNIDLKTLCDVDIHNCSISELMVQYYDETLEGELLSLASCAHLSGLASELIPGLPKAIKP